MDTPTLRPYQHQIRRAIVNAVRYAPGQTITVEIARQGGKNELAAQTEWFLLARYASTGGEIVKCAPTRHPQLDISMRRLWSRLQQSALGRLAFMREDRIELGAASIHFLSAEPDANVAGHTASVLLEADEAQDIDPDKFDHEFRPMAAANNATTVLFGTTWDGRSLLERVKQQNLEAERAGGPQRHFAVRWETVAEHNPAYAAYVENERQRLGPRHPLFLTQYCLETVDALGRMFSRAEVGGMRGSHERLPCAVSRERYVAGLDIAGGDDPSALAAPGRDSTVLTIARIVEASPGATIDEPAIDVVDHAAWTGVPHEQLISNLVEALRGRGIERIAIDATGIGETIARLVGANVGHGRVLALKFTQDQKSRLGFELLAAVQTGRLRIYGGDGSPGYVDCMTQLERARVEYRANRTMNFFVDPSEGHDDYLVSLALAVHAARGAVRRAAIGRSAPA